MTAKIPVFLPGVPLDSNSLRLKGVGRLLRAMAEDVGVWACLSSFPSMEKTASFTRVALTVEHGAGVSPLRAHSETPYGALMLVALAASMKCSDIMLITHSPVPRRLTSESFALSNPPIQLSATVSEF
jgi:hypothetical protein